VIGRLIPDNNADIIVQGFIQSNSGKKLLIVGDVSYKDNYADTIKNTNHHNIIFAGYVNDANELADLYHHCYCYIHGHEFGGTNPTLIQALASNGAILALNTPFSKEMLSDNEYGIYFEKNASSVAEQIQLLDSNNALVHQLKNKAATAITEKYDWDCITEKYLSIMKELLSTDKKA
jgi:glycosyltransferase involved in cell wall biosynthesis